MHTLPRDLNPVADPHRLAVPELLLEELALFGVGEEDGG